MYAFSLPVTSINFRRHRAFIVNVHHFISGFVNISLGVSAVFLTVRWSVGWSVSSGLHEGYISNSLRVIQDEELEVETG